MLKGKGVQGPIVLRKKVQRIPHQEARLAREWFESLTYPLTELGRLLSHIAPPCWCRRLQKP